LVAGVGDPAFFPAESELNELPARDRRASQLFEPPRICIPAGELGFDGLGPMDGETPIGDRCIKYGPVGECLTGGHLPTLDGGQELVH
jgi:hypothetical protein